MTEANEYEYTLPSELIAQHPLPNREDARLMVVDRAKQRLEHWHVRDLAQILHPDDVLVINDTRVLPARLVGYRTRTGGRWQGLFLSTNPEGLWQIMSKTRGRLEEGEGITLLDRQGAEHGELTLVKRLDEGLWAARPSADDDVPKLLECVGRVPLPPYIRDGEMEPADVEAYQTVFAEKTGAVAAPTAGLHFTPPLLERIESRGVAVLRVTLHVGIGTFRPLSSQHIEDHVMHREWGSIEQPTVDALRARAAAGGRVIAVGTTVVRVLETAARPGRLEAWSGQTDLYIHPPFKFHATNALMTNFHVPRSSLLVLVRTFGGDELMQEAYREAIRERYRFFSYGDAMLIV